MKLIKLLLLIMPCAFLAAFILAQCTDSRLAQLNMPAFLPDSAPDDLPYKPPNPYGTRLHLGIGHLRPERGQYPFSWLRRVRLPLFHGVEEQPFAWIANGWFADLSAGVSRPFGTEGLVETEYKSPSFIVYEARADGWLRFRYTPGEGLEGTAWINESHLSLGEAAMVFEFWEDRFMSDEISALFFRKEVPHALRAAPSKAAGRLRWIPSDRKLYHIEPLEVKGDWMYVRVTQPSDYCAGQHPFSTRTFHGWVKWRGKEIGPWLWYYTRGC